MKQQRGFTLIELVMVIVILGILAAVALPRFVDLSGDAGSAAAQGVAGAISSGTAVNYGAKAAGNAAAVTLNGNNAATCTAAVLGNFVTGVTLADGAGNSANATTYNVSAGAGTCVASPGATVTCTIQGSKGVAQPVTVICTGP